ncbi:helix-turn-helix transcriptional regulator [Streptomyces prunicolor]|uniref:Helix-turn-helix transcriptional regulator n=1 Tax=Streptomyces prunicolor TaxID=67348 RepID=A0ABU4F888_9ACTN|nr:helix-turn-helix transcriptional regulator [Streptomyces prunicolor]MDV7216807.1 helix-turn-helix transcriptional regulator [Streptomyces prunicolor]
MDRKELAGFLRTRRAKVRPADAGLPEGTRRRVPGLRRDEVALLAGMSTDYYIELEQGRGPRPSEQMLTVLARALRLTADERDYLFRIAGSAPPVSVVAGHVQPRMRDLLGKLDDTPALVITDLHEVLVQNDRAVALLGPHNIGLWPGGSFAHQWFTNPASRCIYPQEEHPHHSRAMATDLRAALARRGNDPATAALMAELCTQSEEFADLWNSHDVAVRHTDVKRIIHPEQGVIDVYCHNLPATDGRQQILWFSPVPGTTAAQQLAALGLPDASAETDASGIAETSIR